MTNYLGGDETTLKASGVDTHDGEKELPSSVELVTDDFERASLGDEYVGDTGNASIVTSPALEGQRSLGISTATSKSYISKPAEDIIQFGDSFEYRTHLSDDTDESGLSILSDESSVGPFNDTSLYIQLSSRLNELLVQSRVDSESVAESTAFTNLDSNLNETLTVDANLTKGGEITVSVTESGGNELVAVTHNIDDRIGQSGVVKYVARNPNENSTIYFDGPFITRRTTEELSERKRGATETSKLETRGGVGAGPRELPENEPAGILADQGVTSDLSAGTDVGYGLQLNGERGLELRAEADGSGGVQNSVVDLSGLNSNLRLGTGQSIEDGSGVDRLSITSGETKIIDSSGELAFSADSNNSAFLQATSNRNVSVFDSVGGFTGVKYDPSSTAPGTLELTNAKLDLSPASADLRLSTNRSIEDGSGTRRVTLFNGATTIFSNTGDFSNQVSVQKNQLLLSTNSELSILDQTGNFNAVTYTASSSAPGTLELSNSIISRPSSDTTTRTNITETSVDGVPRNSTSSSFKRNVGQTAVDIIDFGGNGMLAVVSGVGPDEGVDRFTDIITATRSSPVTVIESTENGAPPTRDYLKPQPGTVAISVSSGEVQVGAYTIRSSHPP